MAIDETGRWGWVGLRMQKTVNHRLQEGNMKDGVYLEGCRESQSDGTEVHDAVNGVRSNVLGSHLSGLNLERKVL